MALKLLLGTEAVDVEIVRRRPTLVVRIDGAEHEVLEWSPAADRAGVKIDRRLVQYVRVADGNRRILRVGGQTFQVTLVDPRDAAVGADGSGDDVRAPMPGAVVSLHKAAGDPVVRGETILTIESMKLQTALVAPRDGLVAALPKGVGQTFEKDEVVVRLAAQAPAQAEGAE